MNIPTFKHTSKTEKAIFQGALKLGEPLTIHCDVAEILVDELLFVSSERIQERDDMSRCAKLLVSSYGWDIIGALFINFAGDDLMSKTLTEMAQEIAQGQANARRMTMKETASLLRVTFRTLKALQEREFAGDDEDQAGADMDPKKSIRKNRITCLECGVEFKLLTARHLAEHGLDARSYRKKHGIPARQPLCAKYLSERRSLGAKDRGLPENLRKYLDGRIANKRAREAAAANPPEAAGPQAEAAVKKPRGGKKAKGAEPQGEFGHSAQRAGRSS